jgi:hypothetical protein
MAKPADLMGETHIGKLGGEMLPAKEHYARKQEKKVKSEVDSRMNLTGEAAVLAREEGVKKLAEVRQQMERGGSEERDLEEQVEDARREAEMAYGDAEVAQRVREAEERLANFRSEDANKTMIVKPLPAPVPKKKSWLKKLFGG